MGVEHRVEALAARPAGFRPPQARAFERLLPLPEVIAAALGAASPGGKRVAERYEALLREVGTELDVLRLAPPEDIARAAGERTAEGICRMRAGEVALRPGYDGVYGRVELFPPQAGQG